MTLRTGKEKRIRANDPQHQVILQSIVNGTFFSDTRNRFSTDEIAAARCTSGCSALHWAAGSSDATEIVAFLLTFMEADLPCTARSTRGRTPLHYAARNGCVSTAKLLLVAVGKKDPNPRAKHGVTPFQLAVFQNQLVMARWFVEVCRVDPFQTNDFGCGAVHWLAICPDRTASLLPMAEWLTSLGLDWMATQKQGHTPFHKAAWLGHLTLLEYLHDHHNMFDDHVDESGNYAADLADMAGNVETADYLRHTCSRDRAYSCAVLGVPETDDFGTIRRAYLAAARCAHPDRNGCDSIDRFCSITNAYEHLTAQHGRGRQRNAAHSIPLLLRSDDMTAGDSQVPTDDDCFVARLMAVLAEYGDSGVELSNLKKKWFQVWRTPFPVYDKASLRQHLVTLSCVRLERDKRDCWRVYPNRYVDSQDSGEGATSVRGESECLM